MNNLFCCFLLLLLSSSCTLNTKNTRSVVPTEISTIHGNFQVSDPLVLELIASHPMQRLKNITQYGTHDFVVASPRSYDRYTHSIGVYFLLKRHGAPYKEQIAGLLHDVSHTAFSHTTDALFMGNLVTGAYQDKIHLQFLRDHKIDKILNKYKLKTEDMDFFNQPFHALKQSHPELCADRIEYIIYAGYKEGVLSEQEVLQINASLRYENKKWFFTDPAMAKKFASISLHESLDHWGGKTAIYINYKSSELFKAAIDEKIISLDDLLYEKSDNQIWQLLLLSSNEKIKNLFKELVSHESVLNNAPAECAERYFAKFRGVDPWVLISNNNFKRLSTVDAQFKADYDATQEEVKKGYCLQSLNSSNYKNP